MKMNPMFLIDFYKACHAAQYPKNMTKIYEYYTPRMSRLDDVDRVAAVGCQAFCMMYLQEQFNEYFFKIPLNEIVEDYTRIMNATLGFAPNIENIMALHKLGYLPLEIKAVPEGVRTAIGAPQIEISNTHPNFAWLPGTIETMMSDSIWHMQIAAEVGYRYRQIVDKYCEMTCGDEVDSRRLLGDFSMRGQHSIESAIRASAAWLFSFYNTATVPAIPWLEQYYDCDCTREPVGFGAISTEHSVMCSNFAIDGDEITHIRRLLTEIYPNQNFSMVSDSYDYWNLVENILPQLKDEILAHNGCLSIRGDSGDPVEVVTETVFKLWDIFGGMTNSKGYKELDPHIKAIYGDSITPQRCEAIYQILAENGFAINNVVLGVGSFSFMCLESLDKDADWVYYASHPAAPMPTSKYNPYTRDTFGVAIKATHMEYVNNGCLAEAPIFKQPKAFAWKKSQKGRCKVALDGQSYIDELTSKDDCDADNLLQTMFKDGIMVKKYRLAEVRNNLYPNQEEK